MSDVSSISSLFPLSWLSDNPASTPSGALTVQIYQTGHSSTHPSSSGMNAYIASPYRPWILDSEASSHMTGIKDKFTSLHLSTQFSSVNIADVTQSLVLGDRVVQTTPSMNLKNVLYVPKFHVSLLFISQFTKQHNCSVTFFPPYWVFQDLTTGRWIGSDHEKGGMHYLDDGVSPTGLVAGRLILFYSSTGVWVITHCRSFDR